MGGGEGEVVERVFVVGNQSMYLFHLSLSLSKSLEKISLGEKKKKMSSVEQNYNVDASVSLTVKCKIKAFFLTFKNNVLLNKKNRFSLSCHRDI